MQLVMYAIFVVGTAGSGKSFMTARLEPWFSGKGAYSITVNLDPGAVQLPYKPDVDVRDYIDIQTIMESYQLGPNGALILSSDMIATKLSELQNEIDSLNPDYAIVDTPGQMELFTYRTSGPFVVKNMQCTGRTVLFLFDSTLVTTPANFISVALLSSSIQLRLGVPQIPILSKCDLVKGAWKQVLQWSSDAVALEDAIGKDSEGEEYLLSVSILRQLGRLGFAYRLIPFSSETMDGLLDLSIVLSRIFRGGEETEE